MSQRPDPIAHTFAYRLAGSPDMAADLAQEAFLRVLENIERYDPARPFENWICVILRHLYLDWIKRYETSRVISLNRKKDGGNGDRELADSLACPQKDPLADALESEKEAAIQKSLEAMPAELRAPLILCDMEGLSYETIAEAAGCPLGTVRSRIHRGRKMFKELIKDYLNEDSYELQRS
ncbi:MAG: RNA polymerase sigma factor [Elusimicrobia bacterium]|nr:RNA polymerase sigma factor [Elusimicrobiota bacterium]